MSDTPRDEIYQTYIRAREQERLRGNDLSAKQFLDFIAPSKRGRSEASAARYMRKLRTGERSGASLFARSKADAGKNIQIQTRAEGKRSNFNVRLTKSGSGRLQVFQRRQQGLESLRKFAIKQIEARYPEATEVEDAGDVEILGARSIEHTPSGTTNIGAI